MKIILEGTGAELQNALQSINVPKDGELGAKIKDTVNWRDYKVMVAEITAEDIRVICKIFDILGETPIGKMQDILSVALEITKRELPKYAKVKDTVKKFSAENNALDKPKTLEDVLNSSEIDVDFIPDSDNGEIKALTKEQANRRRQVRFHLRSLSQ